MFSWKKLIALAFVVCSIVGLGVSAQTQTANLKSPDAAASDPAKASDAAKPADTAKPA